MWFVREFRSMILLLLSEESTKVLLVWVVILIQAGVRSYSSVEISADFDLS